MKSTKFICIITAAIFAASCSNFFEPTSPSAMDKQYVFESPVRTGNAIEAIYNLFGENNSYRNRLACGYQGLNTDIEHSTKNQDFTLYCMTPSSADLSNNEGKDIWGYINSMVERSNNVIEGIEQFGDTTNPIMAYYLGEALCLRSFAYLELTKYWGDVPVRFVSLEKDPDGIKIPKGDRNEIYDHLRGDLKRAANLLPWSDECPASIKAQNKTTRPSKALAYALLARNNLTYAGYALRADVKAVRLNTSDENLRQDLYKETMEACAEVIKREGSFKLLNDYSLIFRNLCADVEDYKLSEFIWEIPFANGTRGQVMNYNAAKCDKCIGALINNKSGSSNACQTIVPTFIYDFEKGDLRRDVTVLPYVWVASPGLGTGNFSEKDTAYVAAAMPGTDPSAERLWQKSQNISSFFLGKYRVEWMARDRDGNDDGVNFPLVRYADVVLMFCEAAIGGITKTAVTNSTGIDAQAQFDLIRNRAGLAPKTLNMENLMQERAFEFCGEYIRKYDLMRWGKLTENLIATNKRLNDLDAHIGEFAETGDSIYYRFKLNDESQNPVLNPNSSKDSTAYVMIDIWGLRKGETGRPAGYDKEAGWVAKSVFGDQEEGDHVIGPKSNYRLYQDEKILPLRHYYPIFLTNIGTSNGALWNDYDY